MRKKRKNKKRLPQKNTNNSTALSEPKREDSLNATPPVQDANSTIPSMTHSADNEGDHTVVVEEHKTSVDANASELLVLSMWTANNFGVAVSSASDSKSDNHVNDDEDEDGFVIVKATSSNG